MNDYLDDYNELLKKYEKLKEEFEDLESRMIDLLFERNYSIEKELAEYMRELYANLVDEIKNDSGIPKKETLENIKSSILDFARNYKFKL